MNWKVICLLRTIQSFLPFSRYLRMMKRRTTAFPEHAVNQALVSGLELLAMLRAVRFNPADKSIVEVGSGWVPVLPLLFYLLDAKELFLYDKQPLLDLHFVKKSIPFFRTKVPFLAEKLERNETELEHKLDALHAVSLPALLESMRCHYHAPSDARYTRLKTGSVDMVYSHMVMEHIPPPVIKSIFAETRRILVPGGITCHMIDNSDHWIQRDKSISYINFLKYENWLWGLFSLNAIDYQNRLRNYEYKQMLRNAGLDIIHDDPVIERRAWPAITQIELCKKYAGVPLEELALCRSRIIAKA